MITQLLRLGLPISFTRLIQVIGGFLGMLFLAHLGHNYVAAGALISTVRITVIMIFISILFATGVVGAQLAGAKKHHEMGTLLQHAWLLGAILAIPAMFLCYFMGDILVFFNQPAAVIPPVRTFFHEFTWVVPAIMLTVPSQQFLFALRKQKWVMYISTLAAGLYAILSYMFVLGKWGAPQLGVSGLALAYAVQCYLVLFVHLTWYITHHELKKFTVFKLRLKENWQHLQTLWTVGWPMATQFGGELLSLSVTSVIVGLIGVNALAALQVINQYVFLIVVPIFGLAEATSIMVGHAKGGNTQQEIRHIGRASLMITTIFSLIVACFFIFAPTMLSRVFIHGNGANALHTIALLKIIFIILVFTMLFDNARTMFNANLRGLLDTKIPMFIGLGIVWIIGIPLGVLLAFPGDLGLIGIEIGGALSVMIGATLVGWRWHKLVSRE